MPYINVEQQRIVGINPGGSPTFSPAGSVFIDGGSGDVDVFGNFPVDVVNAV